MPYPQQNDYGGSTELVPGGLRTYRHYRLNSNSLASTITTRDVAAPGVNEAQCLANPYSKADKNCAQCRGHGRYTVVVPNPDANSIHRSFVDRLSLDSISFDGLDATIQTERDCPCLTEHSAPNRDCQCGFYASYSPRTDFFAEYIRQLNSHPGGPAFGCDIPPVFAVVEASGRVLMGSTGVRAEKMRVVAMAIDVEHSIMSYRNPSLGMSQSSLTRGYLGIHASEMVMYDMPDPGADDRLQAAIDHQVATLKTLQIPYAARSYGIDVERMIRDYPQPDLSHLIKEQKHG